MANCIRSIAKHTEIDTFKIEPMKSKEEIKIRIAALEKLRDEATKKTDISKGKDLQDYVVAVASVNYIEGKLQALKEVIDE